MRSLGRRLGLGLVLSLCAVFLVQWLLVGYAVRRVAEDNVARRLEHDAESLVAVLALPPALPGNPLPLIYHAPFSGHYFRIHAAGDVLRSRSLWDTDLEVPDAAPGHTLTLHRTGPDRQPLLVLVAGYRKRGTDVSIAVAEDLSPLERDIAALRIGYAGLSLILLVLLIALQQWVVRRGLRPLESVRAEIGRLERGETAALGAEVPSEIAPLVAEINRLLGVLSARLQRSRAALGNLAHAIKTPLTLLAQLTGEARVTADADLRRRIAAQTDAIRRLVDRELKRARYAGAAPGARFVPEREVPALLDTLQRIHRDRDIEVESVLPPGAAFAADREDMLELLGNLLDNAFKWARARVRLRVEDGPGCIITVEDDGPGCEPAQLQRLAARGVRVDESREGHGLGLAIAREIVEQYRGTLQFDRSMELGGMRVVVRMEDG